jgi:ATP adenylyltransferase
MTYIESSGEKPISPTGCIFCDKHQSSCDTENLVVARGKHTFVMLNLYPYNNGHLMVAPYAHTADLSSLSGDTYVEMMQFIVKAQQALTLAMHPDGFNMGMNLGTVAGAGVASHLHMHLVPRWNGDTNFMPVLADIKVMPESLENTLARIVENWPVD